MFVVYLFLGRCECYIRIILWTSACKNTLISNNQIIDDKLISKALLSVTSIICLLVKGLSRQEEKGLNFSQQTNQSGLGQQNFRVNSLIGLSAPV